MKRGDHQVPSERRLERRLGRFAVADLAHHQHFWILPHQRAQAGREVKARRRGDLRLRHAIDRHLDSLDVACPDGGQEEVRVAGGGRSEIVELRLRLVRGVVALDLEAYDAHHHAISLVAGSGLAALYPGTGEARVNSIHHQAVKVLGRDLAVEALSVPDQVIEALRWKGPSYVLGVQWHPEFHDDAKPDLLDGEVLLHEFLGQVEKSREPGARKSTSEDVTA